MLIAIQLRIAHSSGTHDSNMRRERAAGVSFPGRRRPSPPASFVLVTPALALPGRTRRKQARSKNDGSTNSSSRVVRSSRSRTNLRVRDNKRDRTGFKVLGAVTDELALVVPHRYWRHHCGRLGVAVVLGPMLPARINDYHHIEIFAGPFGGGRFQRRQARHENIEPRRPADR